MEYLPQVEKLVEVLSFFMTKLPIDLVNQHVFEKYLTSVNEIISECRKTEFRELDLKDVMNFDKDCKSDTNQHTFGEIDEKEEVEEMNHIYREQPSDIQIKFKYEYVKKK